MYLIEHPVVKGDKNIGKFKDCFKVVGIEYEGGRSTHQAPIGSSARITGSVSCSEIRVSKLSCKASQTLQDSCNFGKSAECKIFFLDSNNNEYLEISLTDALFHNYKFSAKGGVPRESFDITFTSISSRHIPRDAKGIATNHASTTFNLTKGTR